ncbi:MAG: YidC/Oxa1 family insertase periplasmic-domain containing protein [Kiritimatiellia bacterium]|nr:YidC/Oxa1 family insertase periplasmic-domain containing protein [Kiritimatiellia bacterium]
MNKTEKLIVFLLVIGLFASFYYSKPKQDARPQPPPQVQQQVAPAAAVQPVAPVAQPVAAPVVEDVAKEPSVPEETVVLENDELKLEVSTWGAVVKRATLKRYAKNVGELSEENPALVFDFARAPLGAIEGVAGLAANAAYEVKSASADEVVFANAQATRTYKLGANYQLTLEESFASAGAQTNTLSIGAVAMGASKNDLLSVDSWALDAKGGHVVHHSEGDSPLKGYLAGSVGGCSGPSNVAGLPAVSSAVYPGAQKWVALKNRFFVTALASSTAANGGFEASVARDMKLPGAYRPESVAAKVCYAELPATRTSVFYVGPKKQSVLWDLGMKDVMEFGMWRWICYPLVRVLNFFNDLIPSFGVAIILLTILVRLIFWPLTHKSTVGMKKMQELQPKLKEIQAKFKDNPQRLQQETFALYREAKVNPMSSCLPMLIQIPVFIALFNVLRSAVELRYAGFLWIADLSEPEALFASWFPFGGLNLLPILMAVTTALQSYFTPSAGDKSQQRMMMVMMPLMMLFMFYSFPSALSLYWFLSNLFSIVQMWLIRRQTSAKPAAGSSVFPDGIIDPPQTRQMRRHQD